MKLKELKAHLRNIWQAIVEEWDDLYLFRNRQGREVYMEVSTRGPSWLRIERSSVSITKDSHQNVVYSVRILYKLKLSVCWITPIKDAR